MERRTILLVVTLFVFLIVGMFVFAHLNKVEQSERITPPREQNLVESDPYAYITSIDVKQFIGAGSQTLVGVLELPTPCDLLNSTAVVRESLPEVIDISLQVRNTADTCAQVITPQRFMVSVAAGEDATVTVTLNGRLLTVNLIPALPGEKPDTVTIEQKG